MTPSQVKGPKPITDIVTDVRTQMAAILVIVQMLSAAWKGPAEERIEATLRETRSEIVELKREAQAQRARVDSITVGLRQVHLLARVKCIETKNEVIRTMLECRP